MAEKRVPYRTRRTRRTTGAEAMHLLVAEARREAAESRGCYVGPQSLPADITHRQLERLCVEAMQACGYRVYTTLDSRGCPSGFPDIFGINPTATVTRIAAELKVGRDRRKAAQNLWANDLLAVGILCMEVRPEDWQMFLDTIDDGHISRGRALLQATQT